MTLAELSPMQKCRIKEITAEGLLGQRLLDLGFCPGTDVVFIRKAPLSDPIHVKIGDYHIVLRKAEANSILVGTNE